MPGTGQLYSRLEGEVEKENGARITIRECFQTGIFASLS